MPAIIKEAARLLQGYEIHSGDTHDRETHQHGKTAQETIQNEEDRDECGVPEGDAMT